MRLCGRAKRSSILLLRSALIPPQSGNLNASAQRFDRASKRAKRVDSCTLFAQPTVAQSSSKITLTDFSAHDGFARRGGARAARRGREAQLREQARKGRKWEVEVGVGFGPRSPLPMVTTHLPPQPARAHDACRCSRDAFHAHHPFGSPTRGSMASSSRRVIDSAVHVWSTGREPFPWAVPPPPSLAEAATPEALIASAAAAGVAGALIVQPANHMFDHAYVTAALKAHPTFFRGMGLANPTLPPAEAVAALEALHAAGFVGVRFNAGAFEGGLTSDVGRALYKRAGELGMPVGVMCFKGLGPFVPALQALCDAHPETTLVVDHLGFFRQPAIGGQLGGAAANDDDAWAGLLGLARYPQVHVKVSALFRASGEAPPHLDLQPRLAACCARTGRSG